MRKQWVGYPVWLLLTACLYFFENNTGTRIILIFSLLPLLIPALRRFVLGADGKEAAEEAPAHLTVRSFLRPEAEEPGDIRLYQAGDSVRRIHWKLSAKKGELLVREMNPSPETEETEQETGTPESRRKKFRKRAARISFGLMAACVVLLLVVPEARHSAETLCNRVFSASEESNAYAYVYFPVEEHQSILPAAVLLGIGLTALLVMMVLLRSRAIALGVMADCTFFQVYFGLPFPAWVNVPVYGIMALWMIQRPVARSRLLTAAGVILAVSLAVPVLFPGADAATEAVSESVRDQLSRMAQRIMGGVSEIPEGEYETRHLHTLSLQTGENEARTDREYRQVTVDEEQISMPHWINWMKAILMTLLAIALVILPFTPFLLLNARKAKALERRKAFLSEDTSEAVRAIFEQVIRWLDETGHDPGNLLYRDRVKTLPESLPSGYALRFAGCAEDYEEAAYSTHHLPEERRQRALALLKETETSLWRSADWKQRLRIRYWMCLVE